MSSVSDERQSHAARQFDAALRQHREGNLAAAHVSCTETLSLFPEHAPAHFVLGVIELQSGHLRRGIDAILRSLEFDPQQPLAYANLASAYNLLNQPAQALISCERALRLAPSLPLAFVQRGAALRALGRHLESLDSLQDSLRLAPTDVAALNHLGKTLTDLGRFDAAIEAYERALWLQPGSAASRVNLGIALLNGGRPTEALQAFDTAIAGGFHDLAAYYNRGAALLILQRPREASEAFDQALRLDPGCIEASNGRALALVALNRTGEAVNALREALERAPERADLRLNLARTALSLQGTEWATIALEVIDGAVEQESLIVAGSGALLLASDERSSSGKLPRFANSPADQLLRLRAELRFMRGLALQQCGRTSAAIDAYRDSLAVLPDQPRTLNNLGSLLIADGHFAAALQVFSRLHFVAPDHPYLDGHRFMAAAAECQWLVSTAIARDVEQHLAVGRCACSPLPMLAMSDRADLQLQCARSYLRRELPDPAISLTRDMHYGHDRLRIGYLSGDFREHAVGFLMAGVFEHHDRARIATYALSLQPHAPGVYANRIRNAIEHFADFSGLSDERAAARIRELEIDILIDLSGHTRSGRPGILSRRPAPVQINYLGYPGTSGADYIDYLIADEFVITERSRTHYSEHILYLPDCFQANDDGRPAIESAPARDELGLPTDGVILCSFNNLYKLNSELFSVWMRVLQSAPGSVLWLVAASESSRINLRCEAHSRGVDPEAVIFAPIVPYPQHLQRLAAADLFLDTWPFNGGTTVSDALWAGLPVLTCAGRALASRMAGSLLRCVGLDELVTETPENYERRALELAADPAGLAVLRRRVTDARLNSSLFDTQRFTRHLEQGLLQAYRLYEHGFAIRDIRVAPMT